MQCRHRLTEKQTPLFEQRRLAWFREQAKAAGYAARMWVGPEENGLIEIGYGVGFRPDKAQIFSPFPCPQRQARESLQAMHWRGRRASTAHPCQDQQN